MANSDSRILKVADKVGLTTSDVKAIYSAKKRKKISFFSYLLVESIIVVSSFLFGYTLVPEVNTSYPFGPVILFGNISAFSEFMKSRSTKNLIVISLCIFILGLIIGNVAGHLLNITYIPSEGSSVRYGVYSYD